MEQHFLKEIFPAIEKRQKDFQVKKSSIPRACIFFDGHVTRRLRSLWMMGVEKGIDLHTFPAHTSHLLQPLDRCAFASLKRFSFFNFSESV
jgi:hypothetical protein